MITWRVTTVPLPMTEEERRLNAMSRRKIPWYAPLTFTDVLLILLLLSVLFNVFLAIQIWETR